MRKLGEPCLVWGDWMRADTEEEAQHAFQLLFDQEQSTLKELTAIGKIKYPIALEWRIREIGEDEILSAEKYLADRTETN